MRHLRKHFNIDREVVFLNHGSFGATPKPVFATYQHWQKQLERQPVKFLGRDFDNNMNKAREALAAEVGTAASNLAFIPNATHGVNIAARSITLQPGDEILASDQEYGACEYAWDVVCKGTGAVYVRQPISLPAGTQEQMAAEFMAGINDRTRVIFLSHITSPTAVRLPVEAICAEARKRGILTVIDGAHAYGQIDLNLDTLGADYYTSNCHKWALSPKGAAFMYARPEIKDQIDPLIVSWGYGADNLSRSGSRFVDLLQWAGTKDPSAYLSVPAAIDFRVKHGWEDVHKQAKQMLDETIGRIITLPGFANAYADSSNYIQMAAIFIPNQFEVTDLKDFLYDQHKVELPVIQWKDHKLIRISMQAYNTEKDIDALERALQKAMRHFDIQASSGEAK